VRATACPTLCLRGTIVPAMPDSIGHYRIVRQIGRGGMGVVYEALDERLQRAVAIKTILPSADPHVRDRFLREARAAAAVSHPHICQLFEIGEHEGDPFLAMGAAGGRTPGRATPGRADAAVRSDLARDRDALGADGVASPRHRSP
jgi:hypothetical protein